MRKRKMAKFRQYKNGIFGHRHKGYYIIRNNNNQFKAGKLYKVIDANENLIKDADPDYDNCEWFIDKMVANDSEMEVYKRLYDCDIAQLQRMCVTYSIKTEEGTINKEEKVLYKMLLKIRDRKIKELPF